MDGLGEYWVSRTSKTGRGFARWRLSIPSLPTCGVREGKVYYRKRRRFIWFGKWVWRRVAGYAPGEIDQGIRRVLASP